MRHTKQFTSAVLAIIMVLTMLLPATVIPATAATETADDLSKHLFFHYDFEGENPLADKAPTTAENGISSVDDALDTSVVADGTYSLQNGTITATNDTFAMKTASSADVKAIQQTQEVTWFFRFYLVNPKANAPVVVDFREMSSGNNNTRPLWIRLRSDTATDVNPRAAYGLGIQGDGNNSVLLDQPSQEWTPGEWMNMAVVRNYDSATNTYSLHFYFISNDGKTATKVHAYGGQYAYSAPASDNGADIYYFRDYTEPPAKNSGIQGWTQSYGMSYDDIRCYNTALTTDQLQGIVEDEFVTDYTDNMLIHYDFEGAAPFSNKGTSGATDNLILDSTGAYTLVGGTVTAKDVTFGMRVEASATTIEIQKDSATWFFRAKMPKTVSKDHALIDFRHPTVTVRPLWIVKRSTGAQIFVNNATVSVTNQPWQNEEWSNIAVVQRRVGTGVYMTIMYEISDDGKSVVEIGRSNAALTQLNESTNVGFSFFRSWNEKPDNNADPCYEAWTDGNGMSYDDIRCYNVALSVEQLCEIATELAIVPEVDNDALLLHYDFDKTNGGVLANKAANGSSEHNLIPETVYTGVDATTAVEGTDYEVKNGVITAKTADFAMKTVNSGNTVLAQGDQVTWFFRVKANATPTKTIELIDWRDGLGNNRPLCLELNKDSSIASYHNGGSNFATEANNSVAWNQNDWVNIAVVRTKLQNSNRYNTDVYYISNDGKTVTKAHNTLGHDTYHTGAGIDIHYFRAFNEVNTNGTIGGYQTWTQAKDFSYDDIRYYNTALSTDQLAALVASDFGDQVINSGLQKGVGTNANSNKVRLVAQIKGADYAKAGFTVTATWDGKTDATPVDLPCNFAYTSLAKENEDGSIGEETPKAGYYLIAVIVDNIPTNLTNVTLTFTPYADDYTGEAFTYNVSTGAYIQ